MNKYYFPLRFGFILQLFSIVLALNGCRSENVYFKDTLYATELNPYGRSEIDSLNKLDLISAGVHFAFTFTGTQCEVFATMSDPGIHAYIEYELDGVYQKRLRIDGNSSLPLIIQAPLSGIHTVSIYKATEAVTGTILISKVTGKNIKSIKTTANPLIEFIGDSFTSGAGEDTSMVPCGLGLYYDYSNAYLAYGPVLARSLGANYLMSSVSGIGMYRYWNSTSPSMATVYENMDFLSNTVKKWNFNLYSPQIISIALGTNDMSVGDGKTVRAAFDPQAFMTTYINFIKMLKNKYPDAQLVLLGSPVVTGSNRPLLEKCLTDIQSAINLAYPADKQVQTFFFPLIIPQGCVGHPSIPQQSVLADELRPLFRQLLH